MNYFWMVHKMMCVLIWDLLFLFLGVNITTHLDESSPIPLQQRVRVREFIEELLGSMLGGSLDNVCVGQIYKNLECKFTISINVQFILSIQLFWYRNVYIKVQSRIDRSRINLWWTNFRRFSAFFFFVHFISYHFDRFINWNSVV